MDCRHWQSGFAVNDLHIVVAQFEILPDLVHLAGAGCVGVADEPAVGACARILDLINTLGVGCSVFDQLLAVRHRVLADVPRLAGAQPVARQSFSWNADVIGIFWGLGSVYELKVVCLRVSLPGVIFGTRKASTL